VARKAFDGLIGRRTFLLGAAAPLLRAEENRWATVPALLARIQAPKFPAREFVITSYGARDGADSSEAIANAIAACAAAGGGRVVVPPGRFLTGSVHLKSNVNLHVSEGATLAFSQDPKHYLPVVFTRWEGVECMNYSPFVHAFEQTNIAITGKGTLDGQADCEHWWPWKGRTNCGWKKGDPSQQKARDLLISMGERDVPVAERVFGDGSLLRPNFIQPYRCTNVLIEGVTIVNSPMWEIHPVLCRNVTIRGVTVKSHGPNNDGCDPESCRDVLIENCVFDTGDDCIAIKSGRNRDGRRLKSPSNGIVVRGCTMKDGHGGVTIGSEASGGVSEVFVERCRMDSPNLERALRLKTNSYRGGFIEHVYMRDVTVGQVSDAVLSIDLTYEEGAGGGFNPLVRAIEMKNVTCTKSKYGVYLKGYADVPLRGVSLEGCHFDGVEKGNVIEHAQVSLKDVRVNGTPWVSGSPTSP
jgi:polygalacturonase